MEQDAAVKVLLIDPPFYRLIGFYNRYFPLGLLSVGTFLRKRGHDVVVYDADYNERPRAMDYTRLPDYYPGYLSALGQRDHPVWREVRETIRRVGPDVIGVSVWTTYAAAAFRVAELAKEIAPGCPVVAGGPHATARAEETLRIAPAVDYVVRGDGELPTAALLDTIAGDRGKLEAVAGLSYRDDERIRHNPNRSRIRDLDELPTPDRNLLLNAAHYSSEDMGLIVTSRGCPFSCSFCATNTRQVRYRSIDRVVVEIREVKARYGTTQFSLKDDSFTVDHHRVRRFCDALLRENLHIVWECNTRVDLVTEDMLARMKHAGCNSVKVGIESGSPEILERMNKGITLTHARVAASLLRKSGIHWTGYFLMGTPGETLDDVYRTLDFMYEIRPDFASIGVYEPFPGSATFHEGVQRGLFRPQMTMDDFYNTLPNHYYKVDPGRQLDTIEPEQFVLLEREMKARFHAYNNHYKRLLNRVRSRTMHYIRSPRALYGDFQKYLCWRQGQTELTPSEPYAASGRSRRRYE